MIHFWVPSTNCDTWNGNEDLWYPSCHSQPLAPGGPLRKTKSKPVKCSLLNTLSTCHKPHVKRLTLMPLDQKYKLGDIHGLFPYVYPLILALEVSPPLGKKMYKIRMSTKRAPRQRPSRNHTPMESDPLPWLAWGNPGGTTNKSPSLKHVKVWMVNYVVIQPLDLGRQRALPGHLYHLGNSLSLSLLCGTSLGG